MMIERIALALYLDDSHSFEPLKAWSKDSDRTREWYRDRARVAIAAMLEPTDAMINAGKMADILEFHEWPEYLSETDVRTVWRNMHAAMLTDGRPK